MYEYLVFPVMPVQWSVAARAKFENPHAEILRAVGGTDDDSPGDAFGRGSVKRPHFSL